MSTTQLDSLRLPVGGGWIHALLRTPQQARGRLLLLPPFLHEWQRSYRLFALFCEALAEHGIVTLRFDYRGCGDSSGEDHEFLPSRALADAEVALAALLEHGEERTVLLGVRAGHLLGSLLADRHALPCWAWQPVEDGRAYFNALRLRDREERNNRLRYPFLTAQIEDDPAALMGQRLHPEFGLELAVMRAAAPALRLAAADDPPTEGETLSLEPALSSWVEQIGISGPPPLAAARTLAAALAARWPA